MLRFMDRRTRVSSFMSRRRSGLSATIALGGFLTLAGCKPGVDLDAVRALQVSADTAQASYNALADDYYDSCVRRVEYESVASSLQWYVSVYDGGRAAILPRGAGLTDDDRAADAVRIAKASTAAVIGEVNSADMTAISHGALVALMRRSDLVEVFRGLHPPVRIALDQRLKAEGSPESIVQSCAKRKIAAGQWRQANDVLVGYFDALGALAGAPRTGDSFAVGELAGALRASDVLSESQAAAVSALGTTVVGAVFDARRRGELGHYIPQADAALGAAVTALELAAQTHYGFALRQESDELEAFLSDNFIVARPGVDAFEVLQYGQAWNDKRRELDARRTAADDYIASLEALRAAHGQLLGAIEKNDDRAVYGIAKALYDQIDPDIRAIRKAFEVTK